MILPIHTRRMLAAGRVRTFVHEQPSLVELFREVVPVGAAGEGAP